MIKKINLIIIHYIKKIFYIIFVLELILLIVFLTIELNI